MISLNFAVIFGALWRSTSRSLRRRRGAKRKASAARLLRKNARIYIFALRKQNAFVHKWNRLNSPFRSPPTHATARRGEGEMERKKELDMLEN
jgi:hypothetical protein